MSDEVVLIIVVAVIGLVIVGWVLYLAAGLVLAFTAFVMELPTIVTVLMFIVFPPTFIVFLVGLAFIRFGIADALVPSDSDQSTVSKRDSEAERARRRALGYDE